MKIFVVLLLLNTFNLFQTNKYQKRTSNYYHKQSGIYIKKYGLIANKVDTIINRRTLQCIYRNGYLVKIGHVKNGKKIGDWYFYDSLKLSAVAIPETDSTWKPVLLINSSW